jgi:concentrative nucleoside transporter, CNT family
MLQAAQGVLGLIALPMLAWAMSENRRALWTAATWRVVLGGIVAQFVIAGALLAVPQTHVLFDAIGAGVRGLQEATQTGMRFVFGFLAGGPTPYAETSPGNGFILALRALPLILLMSVLSRVLYHWGVLQVVVRGISAVLRGALGISGPLGIAAAAKVFLGMVEAPLLIRPYLVKLGRGELFALMSVGMATVAGTVFALYAAILEPVIPGAAGHVLTASLMNVPAALMLARLVVPDGFAAADVSVVALDASYRSSSTMDAIAQGTADGLKLLAYVAAMLVVMVALVELANGMLGAVASTFGHELTIQRLLGVIAAPFAFLIGVPWSEAGTAGALIGLKVVLNELLAYLELVKLPAAALSDKSRTIMTYALCGFGNLGSLGILVGGLSAMAPERRTEIAELGLRSVLVGLMATLLTGAVVGIVLGLRS